MKVIIYIIFCLSISYSCLADPHYVQALHPFMGEEQYKNYLETFNAPISVVTDSVMLGADSGMVGSMYIYIYRFNQNNLINFTINIACPNREENISNLDYLPENSYITKKYELSWKFKSKSNKKVVLFYSTNSPIKRNYYLNNNNNNLKVLGPSCK